MKFDQVTCVRFGPLYVKLYIGGQHGTEHWVKPIRMSENPQYLICDIASDTAYPVYEAALWLGHLRVYLSTRG
jgi:hypothetical protein